MALKLRRGTDLERQSVIFEEGELVYTTDTKELWIGDGQTLGGIKVIGQVTESPITLTRNLDLNGFDIVGAGDVDIIGSISASSFIGDGSGLANLSLFDANTQYKIDILSSDQSSLLLDSNTNTLVGTVIGDVYGDIFTTEGAQVIDSITGSIFGTLVTNHIYSDTSKIRIENNLPNTTNEFKIASDNNRSVLRLTRTSETDISGSTEAYGAIYFERQDINGFTTNALVIGRPDSLILTADTTSVFDIPSFVTVYSGGLLGVGTANPTEKLDVRGNGKFTGFVQFGSLTTTERNALTAANGMVIYNTTDNRFQGYQNGAWINLDNGSAA